MYLDDFQLPPQPQQSVGTVVKVPKSYLTENLACVTYGPIRFFKCKIIAKSEGGTLLALEFGQ